MKFRGKKLSEKAVLTVMVLLFVVGTASAAMVSYMSNSMTATVDVTSAAGLSVGVIEGLESDPTITTGWQTSGTLALTGLTAGETSIVTMMINNSAGAPLTTTLDMNLAYLAAVGLADPMNCINGGYDATGTEECAVCDASTGLFDPALVGVGGGVLCIDAQEFEVVGFKEWNVGVGKWDPEVGDNPFSSVDCFDSGITVPGTYNNDAYLDLSSECWWNIQDDIAAGTTPANPLVMASTPVSVPTGIVYYAVALKTKADPVANVQLAPGTYSLTVTTS